MSIKELSVVEAEEVKPKCGIVMPISTIDGCSEQHWSDVLEILNETIEIAGFEPNLVSNADDIGIIQKRIIQNLYENPIVICDVSGKNPNVMFELGMRLAFDKPTIIIKDDHTTYSFDTSAIEHISYPRDLRFNKIIEFKKDLKQKIVGTYNKAKDDPGYSTFLKHFGQFKVAKIDTTEVSKEDYILEEIKDLRRIFMRTISNKNSDNYISERQNKIARNYPDQIRFSKCKKEMEKAILDIMTDSSQTGITFDDITKDPNLIETIKNASTSLSCFDPEKEDCINTIQEIFSDCLNNKNLLTKRSTRTR